MRPCSDTDGSADATRCDCDDALCRSFGADAINAPTGENLGRNFCQPCIRSNRGHCGSGVACCDPGASCGPHVLYPDSSNNVCCRQAPDSCDPGAGIPQCCENAFCNPTGPGTGVCTLCGTDGTPPTNSGCCPGTVLVGAGTATPVCRGCTRGNLAIDTRGGVRAVGYCGDEVFEVRSSDGRRSDGTFVASSDVSYPYVFEGLLAGGLVNTSGDAAQALIDLGPEYRAYLFRGDLRSVPGITAGERYVELPNDDLPDGGPLFVSTGLGSASSFALHDLGACSARVSWPGFAGVIGAGVNQEVAERVAPIDGSRPLLTGVTARGLDVRPVIHAVPADVYGLARDESHVEISTRYSIGGLGGVCGPNDLTITASVLPDLVPGFIITPEARTDDQLAAMVGCAPVSPSDTEYVCTVPYEDADGVFQVRSARFPRQTDYYFAERRSGLNGVQELALLDTRFGFASCRPVRDRIECVNVPRVIDGDFECHPDGDNCPCTSCEAFCQAAPFSPPGFYLRCDEDTAPDDPYEPTLVVETRAFPRRVEFVPGARDVELTVLNVTVTMTPGGCFLDWIITGALRGIIEREIRGRISVEVSRAIQLIIGSRASTQFGVPVSSIPTCAFDSDCAAGYGPDRAPLFGGSRHGCVDHDGNPGTANICDLVQFEMRRLYVGPRGVDIVLADGPDDPQYTPISGRSYPPPIEDNGVSCDPGRFVWRFSPPLSIGGPLSPTTVGDGDSNPAIGDRGRPFCIDGTMAPSTCICREPGTGCGNPNHLAIAGFIVPDPDADLTCQMGRCCEEDGVTCATRRAP